MGKITANRRLMAIAIAGAEAMWLGLFISKVNDPLAICVCIYIAVTGVVCIYNWRAREEQLKVQYLLVGVIFILDSLAYILVGLEGKLWSSPQWLSQAEAGILIFVLIIQIAGFGLVGSILVRTFPP